MGWGLEQPALGFIKIRCANATPTGGSKTKLAASKIILRLSF
jgi:hypothetical protein